MGSRKPRRLELNAWHEDVSDRMVTIQNGMKGATKRAVGIAAEIARIRCPDKSGERDTVRRDFLIMLDHLGGAHNRRFKRQDRVVFNRAMRALEQQDDDDAAAQPQAAPTERPSVGIGDRHPDKIGTNKAASELPHGPGRL